MSRRAAIVVFLVLGVHAVGAQQVRDPAIGKGTTGTGRIAGRVVTVDATPQPMRRVIVTLTAPELPGSRGTVTDAAGRFAFDRLPSGRYVVAG